MCKLCRGRWPGPSLNGVSVLGQVKSPDIAAAGNQVSAKCIDLSSRAGVQDDGLFGQPNHEADCALRARAAVARWCCLTNGEMTSTRRASIPGSPGRGHPHPTNRPCGADDDRLCATQQQIEALFLHWRVKSPDDGYTCITERPGQIVSSQNDLPGAAHRADQSQQWPAKQGGIADHPEIRISCHLTGLCGSKSGGIALA